MSLIDNTFNRLGNLFGSNQVPTRLAIAQRQQDQILQQDIDQQASNKLAAVTNQLKSDFEIMKVNRAQGNPVGGGFTDVDDFDEYVKNFNSADITVDDYFNVYGAAEGARILNDVGFFPAIFGQDARLDENRTTYDYSEGLVPYIRKVEGEGDNRQIATYPVMTQLGPSLRETIERQGGIQDRGTAPDGTPIVSADDVGKVFPVGEFSIDLRNNTGVNGVFRTFAQDTYRLPQVNAGFNLIANNERAQNMQFFTPEALNEFAEILNSEGQFGQAGPVPADGVDVNVDGLDTRQLAKEGVDTSEDVPRLVSFESAKDVKGFLNASKDQKPSRTATGPLGVAVDTKAGTDIDNAVKFAKALNIDIDNFVKNPQTNVFNLGEDIFQNLSFNDRQALGALENLISQENIDKFFSPLGADKDSPGFRPNFKQRFDATANDVRKDPTKGDEAEGIPQVRKWMIGNQEKLQDVFSRDAAEFAEFKLDPYEYSRKYYQNEKEIFGDAAAAKEASGVIKKVTNTKVTTDQAENFLNLYQDGKLGEAADVLKGISDLRGGPVTEDQQTALVEFFQKYDGNHRALTSADRISLAGTILASLPENDLSRLLPSFMRYIESGKFDYGDEAIAQRDRQFMLDYQELVAEQQKEQNTFTVIGNRANDNFDTISGLAGSNDFTAIDQQGLYTMAARDVEEAFASGTNVDKLAAGRTFSLALKTKLQQLAKKGWWRNTWIGDWFTRDVNAAQFNLTGNLKAYDRQNNPITNMDDANKVSYFRYINENGLPAGNQISVDLLKKELGTAAVSGAFINSLSSIAIGDI